MSDKRKFFAKVALDLLATFLVGLPFFLLYFIGNPYKRGFYCDDESIRYPFKESTISSGLLFSVSIITSLIVILTTEFMSLPGMNIVRGGRGGNRQGGGQPLTQFIWIIYHQLIVFTFGALASQTLTDIAKYSIGRLRPHFLSICQVNINCDDPGNKYKYIEDYHCLDDERLRDARLSFMSGHSSFSAYCAVYIAIYLQNRVKNPKFALPRGFLQVLVIYLSIYTGFTRISDYKHHWSDVLVGLIQGSLVAILTARFVANLFRFTFSASGLSAVAVENSSIGEDTTKRGKNFSTFEVDHETA